VCPKGFDGTYRLLVRRVWGNVTGGRVNVEVITHYRGPNSANVRKKVTLNNDEALVTFDLKGGRRKEPLREQQVANAVGGQLAVNRQILAQQLAAAVDPGVLQQLALARSGAGNGAGAGNDGFPFFAGGAVGYQPVIITLPKGANLAATAVISADRRYVRITCVPLFSGVSEVTVFNMASGSAEASDLGTGFGGFSGNQGGGGNATF